MTQTRAITNARDLPPGTVIRLKERPRCLRRLVERRPSEDGWKVDDLAGEGAPWLNDRYLAEAWEVVVGPVSESSEIPGAPVQDLFVLAPREVATTIADWWKSGNLGSVPEATREALDALAELVRDPRQEKIEGLAFLLFQEHRRSMKLLGGPAAWKSLGDDVRQAFRNMAKAALDMLEADDA